MAFPQIFSLLLQRSTVIINVFFISLAGYYGIETFENTQATIKGIGLGSIIINVFFFGVSSGLNGGLETLVAYAYACSENVKESDLYRIEMKRQCGNYLNIARLINSILMVCVTVVLILFADEILITFFKQNAFVSEIAIQYSIICLPGIWSLTQFDATKKYLSALKLSKIPILTQLLTRMFQMLLCNLLIVNFQWGVVGAAIATNIVYIMDMVIQDFWISFKSETQFQHLWLPWSRSNLDGLFVFLEYSIPNAIMEGFFLFSLELIVCVSGYGIIISRPINVEKRDFSAITVSMNILSVIMIIASGMSYTISAFVGGFQA